MHKSKQVPIFISFPLNFRLFFFYYLLQANSRTGITGFEGASSSTSSSLCSGSFSGFASCSKTGGGGASIACCCCCLFLRRRASWSWLRRMLFSSTCSEIFFSKDSSRSLISLNRRVCEVDRRLNFYDYFCHPIRQCFGSFSF